MELSEELKQTRKSIKQTQAGIGELLGVSGNTIARWERGEMTPDSPQMLRLALRALALEYGELPLDPAEEKRLRASFRRLKAQRRQLEKLVAQG